MKRLVIGCLIVSSIIACSKSDDTASSAPAAAADSSKPAYAPGARPGANSVRGQLVSMSDTTLVVDSRGTQVTVAFSPPLEVYSRVPAKLSDVKPNSFVGITSAPQADGTMRASEIHIFPDKLRGTNEGSFAMGQRGGGAAPGGGSTMTNGTVSGGGSGGAGNQMTNGTVGTQNGNSLTVKFQNDSQTIVIPSDVTVTQLTLTNSKLTPGTNVVVQTTKGPDGSLRATRVMLSQGRPVR